MTYQEFSDLYVKQAKLDYFVKENNLLSNLEPAAPRNSGVLHQDLVSKYNWVNSCLNTVLNHIISQPTNTVKEVIMAKYSTKQKNYDDAVGKVHQQYKKALEAIDEKRQYNISYAKESVLEYKNSFLDSIADIVKMYNTLQGRKDEVQKLLALHGMSYENLYIDSSLVRLNDIRSLLNLAIYATDNMCAGVPIFDKALSLVYLPAIKKFEDETTQLVFSLVYLIGLGMLFYFLKPHSMAFIGIIFLAFTGANIFKMRERKELLQGAYSIIDSVNLESFIETDEIYQQLLSDVTNAEADNFIDDIIQLDATLQSQLLEVEANLSPEKERQEELNLCTKFISEIDKDLGSQYHKLKKAQEARIVQLKVDRAKIDQQLVDLADEFVSLGNTYSLNKVLDLKMRLALDNYKGRPLAESGVELPLKNIIFRYSNLTEFNDQISHLKLLLVNFLCNVKYMELAVDIVDTNDLGREFTEFIFEDDLQAITTIHTSKAADVFSTYKNRAETDIKKLGKETIQQFNARAQELKMVSIKYNLMIVVSTDTVLHDSEPFQSFMEYSATTGNFIWYLLGEAKDKSSKEKMALYAKFQKTALLSKKAYTIEGIYDGNWGSMVPYRYTSDLAICMKASLAKAFETDPGEIRTWEEYMERYIPREKWWTYNTQDGIEFTFGYQDGDPSKGRCILLGDALPHGLAIGATGAGKSAFANMLFGGILVKYPPEEIMIIMVDFKNAEFPMYTGINSPPHVKLISGTRDGEYIISLFDYLLEEMKQRTLLFRKYNVQNIMEYNKIARKKPELLRDGDAIMPRMLLYIDEFTTMYDGVAPKALTIIENRQKQLANLARFCGLHMFFQTQNFSGTMSKAVMEQFSLRVCLRAASAAAEMIVGTKLPAFLPKRGQCYTNEDLGESQKSTKRWVLPFLSGNYMNMYLPKLATWCDGGLRAGETHIKRNLQYYNEDEIFTKARLDEVYKLAPALGDAEKYCKQAEGEEAKAFAARRSKFKRSFLLGERTKYVDTTDLPVTCELLKDFAESLISISEESKDLVNLVNTYIENLSKKKFTYVVNCQDSDIAELLDLEKKVNPEFLPFLSRDLSAEELIDAFEALTEEQNQNLNAEPFYIILVCWELMPEIGIAVNNRLVGRFANLIRNASKADVHFILAGKESASLADLRNSCNHRVLSSTSTVREFGNLIGDEVKLAENFAVYRKRNIIDKFKIYDLPMNGAIGPKELRVKF